MFDDSRAKQRTFHAETETFNGKVTRLTISAEMSA